MNICIFFILHLWKLILIFIEFLVLEFFPGIICIASFARHDSAYNYLVNCIIWVCIFIKHVSNCLFYNIVVS